jgi:heptosyltransferase-2
VDSANTVFAPANTKLLTDAPVLVVQTAFLGDLLLTIPLLRRLRQLKPLSPLILVAREGAGRLMKELELVDEVYEIRKGDPGSYRAAQEQLKKRRYEWIVCPHQSMTSAKFCWGLPAQVKVSFKQWWNFPFFKHRVDRNPMWPEPIRLLSLLQGLDPEMGPWLAEASKTELRKADIYGRLAPVPLWASVSLREKLVHRPSPLPAGNRTVCIFPGSIWATKKWNEESFIELAERLVREGHEIYWMGSKEEMPMTKKMEVRVRGSHSVAGQLSLFQSLVLLSHSRLAISNDSAGQHLAAVAGAPTVSIFGPTILDFGFRPWNSQAMVAELFDVPCRPCGPHGHKKCPKGTHECMKRLPVALVTQRVHQLLSQPF